MMGDTEFKFDKEARDPFEAVETLSLSDLPITGDSAHLDYSYSKDGADDFFEFISEDFSASSTTMDRDIIFCGKIIKLESSKDANQSNTNQSDDDSSDVLLPWILNKQTSKSTISGDSAMRKVRELKDSKDYYSRGRVSFMRSATKRWYLFMFRMPSIRLPAEMELRDIRNKQRRRNVPAAGEEEMVSKSINERRICCFAKMFRSWGLGCRNTVSKQTTAETASCDDVNTSSCWR